VRYPLDGPGIGDHPGAAYAGRILRAPPFTAALHAGEFGQSCAASTIRRSL